jgi:hypothetical protein
LAAADSIPERRPRADVPALCRRRLPETVECDLIGAWQGRVRPPARAYLERKQSEGKRRREAIRCLKRQLARTVYTILRNEALLT